MLTANGQILQLSAPAAMAISAEGKDAHGNPVRSYTKIILRAGVTVRNTGGNQVTITGDMLDQIAKTYGEMKTGGIKVPIQLGHTDESDKTRGYVTDVWRDGNDLWAKTEMVGADGIMLASRSEVSVYVEPEREINGTKYRMALVHLACVPDPQVPGLGAFLPIAASLKGQVFTVPTQGKQPMSWKPLALILSLDVSKLNDETGPGAVEAATKSAVDARNAANAELSTIRTAHDALKLSASKGAPAVDQDILDEHADIIGGKLDGLVSSGIVNPAQKDKLSKLFTGEKGKRPALCLSRAHATHAGLAEPIALSVISILAEGKGRKTGEKTGAQGSPSTGDELTADELKAFTEAVGAAAR